MLHRDDGFIETFYWNLFISILNLAHVATVGCGFLSFGFSPQPNTHNNTTH